MKPVVFERQKEGFYGAYWKDKKAADACIIAMLGDDALDHLAKSSAAWLMKRYDVNVLTMSPAKKDYSHHNYPLECIEKAIVWLKKNGNERIGIAGASTTGTLSLTAASYFPDITLTIAMTPSDFIWQGFAQGKKDGCGEWPCTGESLFSYRGNSLPYMPFCYDHPDYYQLMRKESKETGNLIASRRIFDDSETAHPLQEEEFVKIENIKGVLLLVGAKDDSLWDTAKYIQRAEKRLVTKPHKSHASFYVYEHGTHFVFPQSMLHHVFPIGSSLLVKLMFKEARKHPKECKKTRLEVQANVDTAIKEWLS